MNVFAGIGSIILILEGFRMEKFCNWWKQDKRYITLLQSVLLGLLPVVCCLVYCAMQGRSIGEVYLPGSEWNDELFYYKQVESIVQFGYPQGYFGFNESHALKLSFAAWSPVLVFPWIIWGLLFGWNMMSPVICNILLMVLACVLFVWLVRPSWKQQGILTLLFCLYTPFVRYMLSVMPEVICFSILIIFYALAINYQRREKTYKLVLLFVISGVMTLMRPYCLLFMLLPVFFWIRKSKWKGAIGSAVVFGVVLGIYAAIKHYFGAEYFAPLFFTDWVQAFFDSGILEGIRYTLGKLYYMGLDFISHTRQGFTYGLASGAFFAGFLVCMLVLLTQSFVDYRKLCRLAKSNVVATENTKKRIRKIFPKRETDRSLADWLIIEAHLAISFVAMLFALLLMYKLTEGSKHLLTFMAVAVFIIALMDTKFFKKTVLVGVTFAYFYTVMAVDPYDYQVPFAESSRVAAVEQWQEELEGKLVLVQEDVPNYDNVVIWVFSDVVDGSYVNTAWQLMYALPEGFGISCCMADYVNENFDDLQSKYLCVVRGGGIEERCEQAGFAKVIENADTVIYQRY